MTEADTTIAPSNGQATQTTAPQGNGQSGQATQPVQTQPDSDVPEKFKGKSAGDIAKSYLELEKKLGEQSKSVKETRDLLDKWEQLGQVLEADPELYKQVEQSISKFGGSKSDTTVNDQVPKHNDTRIATENIIINNFEKQYGIDALQSEKRTDLHKKIGIELAEMLDPGGGKPIKEVLDTIPLDRLPRYLDKAYRLATMNDSEEQIRSRAVLEARQNNEASFSSTPSSSIRTSKGQLTDKEKEVARKQGISEEKYLENKIALQQ